MINTIEQFGRNAGVIWQLLSEHGALKPNELQQKSQLRDYEVNIGIGWLARENKIAEENKTYYLSDTNLTDTIGSSAGEIYAALSNQEKIQINQLQSTTTLSESEFYRAIGWLAREDKIQLHLQE